MKKFVGLLVLIGIIVAGAYFLGFNPFAPKVQNPAELEQLEHSRETWNQKNESGNYLYVTSFESWVGFGSETTIFVTDNVVTGRSYSSYDADRNPTESYEEDAASVGSNGFGAPVKTIDELYAMCTDILTTKDPAEYYITFRLFGDNLLNICEYSDKRCADDCSEGVRIDTISFTDP